VEQTERRMSGSVQPVPYVYNGRLHDLMLSSIERVRRTEIGGRSYSDLLRGRFQTRDRTTGERTDFEITYGASGHASEIPVHIVYQPRWWFQVELFLDDKVQF
jgi:hypothetical protein